MKTDNQNSNVSRLPEKAMIKQQAGAWIVKIDQGNLSPEQVREFQSWLSQSKCHKQYIEKLARNWDSMSILSELAALFPLSESSQAEKAKVTKSRFPLWITTSVSVCLLIATIAFNLNFELEKTEFITDVGQQTEVTLEDGSKVSLNTDSHLEVNFSGDIRVLRLLKGEAHFNVAKNPKRPFVVYVGNGMVWAVGTAFNVRYTDINVDVVVTEGTVKVYAGSEQPQQTSTDLVALNSVDMKTESLDIEQHEVIAQAGQTVSYDDVIEQHQAIEPKAIDKRLAWQTGYLSFSGESLEQALIEIGRYTDKEIVITDEDIKAIQIGGHFKTDDIDGLLVSLGQGFDLDIKYIGKDRVWISEKMR